MFSRPSAASFTESIYLLVRQPIKLSNAIVLLNPPDIGELVRPIRQNSSDLGFLAQLEIPNSLRLNVVLLGEFLTTLDAECKITNKAVFPQARDLR
jgi:hypothetical protein